MGKQEVALVMMPLIALALPIAARAELFARTELVWIYGLVAIVAAACWIAMCIASIVHNKEAFYRRHERPLLSKEYQDG